MKIRHYLTEGVQIRNVPSIGNKVKIKSYNDIKKTFTSVSEKGNFTWGCQFLPEMEKHCGKTYYVKRLTPLGNVILDYSSNDTWAPEWLDEM